MKREYELRVDLKDMSNNTSFAQYGNFSLSRNALNPENDGYRLYLGAFTDGEAGNPPWSWCHWEAQNPLEPPAVILLGKCKIELRLWGHQPTTAGLQQLFL